ncbi:MAG: Hsp70 family protein [Acidobacteriota bacterium]
MYPKTIRFSVFLILLSSLLWSGCSMLGTKTAPAAKLSYSIGINTTDGYTEMIPAGQALPTLFSETYSNEEDKQETVAIEISQKRDDGIEKIVDVEVPIPARSEGEVEMLITVKVDANKMLTVKSSVMESGQVKGFGPFPVE